MTILKHNALLSSVFRYTSSTYKFYWFWAILELVESNKRIIPKKEIFAKMISLAWYTVNYFQVSFGKQDEIQSAVKNLKEIENLKIDTGQLSIYNTLINSKNKETLKILNHFNHNVPHKFLSPWLGSGSKSSIYEKSVIKFYEIRYYNFR